VMNVWATPLISMPLLSKDVDANWRN